MDIKNHVIILAAFVLLPAFVCSASAKTIYVDADAAGANNGSSWANAYPFLQDALADANSSPKPVEIRVAQGVYTPDSNSAVPEGTGDREATFQLINGLSLIGGYAGFDEPDPNERDVEAYETILSGDLDGNDVKVNDPYDLLNEPSRDENSCHVVTGSGTDVTAVIDGFTITAGNAYGHGGHDFDRGGGMYNSSANPRVTECTFAENSVVGCSGGMYNCNNSNPKLTDCTFHRNFGGHFGGGMVNMDSNPTLTKCRFSANIAMYGGGGGISNLNSSPILIGCTFISNSPRSGSGGGIDNGHSNPILAYCTFISNSAMNGGGINNLSSSPTLTQCTFTSNTAEKGGGMCNRDSSPTLNNCIFWANSPGQVCDHNSTTLISYSDVQGGWQGQGNIDADPCFAEPGHWEQDDDDNNDDDYDWVDGDYHLKSHTGRYDPNSDSWVEDDVTSPCIDAGNPLDPIGMEPFPNGGIINMGAYGGTSEASKSYFDKPPCEIIVAGDINGDCEINFKDFTFIALHWLRNP